MCFLYPTLLPFYRCIISSRALAPFRSPEPPPTPHDYIPPPQPNQALVNSGWPGDEGRGTRAGGTGAGGEGGAGRWGEGGGEWGKEGEEGDKKREEKEEEKEEEEGRKCEECGWEGRVGEGRRGGM